MNKFVEFAKSFYGLVIYFAVNFITAYIVNSFKDQLSITVYNIILIASEVIILGILIFLNRKKIKKDFIDFDKHYKKHLKVGIKAWLIGLLFMVISNYIIYNFFVNNIASNQEINTIVIQKMPLYTILGMIILGPFSEEIMFRLSFFEHIKNKYVYYILTVLIFAGMHTLNGMTSPIELLYFIPYGCMAVSFSYVMYKTKNVFTTTVIHTCHNAISVLLIAITPFFGG